MFKVTTNSGTGTTYTFFEQAYQITYADQDVESGRNPLTGEMKRNYVNCKKTLEITMPPMTNAQMHSFLNAISPSGSNVWQDKDSDGNPDNVNGTVKNLYMEINFLDPRDAKATDTETASYKGVTTTFKYRSEGIFYVGDRTPSLYSDKKELWSSFSVEFVEK